MVIDRTLCALILALTVVGTARAQTSTITPQPVYPPTQLQSGITPYVPYPQQSGIVPFGTSNVTSGVTSIHPNPLAEETPVRAYSFTQGGVSRIPGGDTASQSTNATNATNAAGGRGFSNNRGR